MDERGRGQMQGMRVGGVEVGRGSPVARQKTCACQNNSP